MLCLATVLGPSGAWGQVVDSLPPDSLPRDTVDYTARFLEAQARAGQRLPVLPRAGPRGPAPAGARLVFTRDSIEWATSGTLADLLDDVPGVFVWRGGWVLEPELASYRGRGATSIAYVVDGVPFLPLGPDSLGVDPATFALALYDRIEIERWPDRLTVRLFSRRHDRVAPASRIEIGTGDRDIARYQASFEKRWPAGVWLGLGGEFMAVPEGTVENGDRDRSQFWGQFGVSLTSRLALQIQMMTTDIQRDAVFAPIPGDTVGRALDGSRVDRQVRVAWGGTSPLGWRADAIVAHSSWSGEGLDTDVTQYILRGGRRTPTSSLGLTLSGASRRTDLALVADAGWTPTRAIALSAEAGWARLEGDRSDRWLGVHAGLTLPLGFHAGLSGRIGSEVSGAADLTDPAQRIRAAEATLGWASRPVAVEVGVARTGAFAPDGFQPYRVVAGLRPLDARNWLTASVRLAPKPWLTVDAWYSDVLDGSAPADGQPPTHTVARLTLRSKFLRPFPSGIFDLKLQAAMETWGSGTLGLDGSGATVALPGMTFVTGLIQMELGSFRAFYQRSNLLGAGPGAGYLPGFPIPAFATSFGVRWDFLN